MLEGESAFPTTLFHPSKWVLDFLRTRGVESIELATYRYIPADGIDERHVEFLDVNAISLDLLQDIAARARRADSEIAVHSRVRLPGSSEAWHLPMIDLLDPLTPDGWARIERIARKSFGSRVDAAIVRSGRSEHIYFFKLIPEHAWVSFMTRLLLVNEVGGPYYIDWRWISHRLEAGYSSLRWSCNTRRYVREPCVREFCPSGSRQVTTSPQPAGPIRRT